MISIKETTQLSKAKSVLLVFGLMIVMMGIAFSSKESQSAVKEEYSGKGIDNLISFKIPEEYKTFKSVDRGGCTVARFMDSKSDETDISLSVYSYKGKSLSPIKKGEEITIDKILEEYDDDEHIISEGSQKEMRYWRVDEKRKGNIDESILFFEVDDHIIALAMYPETFTYLSEKQLDTLSKIIASGKIRS